MSSFRLRRRASSSWLTLDAVFGLRLSSVMVAAAFALSSERVIGNALPSQRQEGEHDGFGRIVGRLDDVGCGLIWLLILIVLVLAIAALIKYLRS